MEVTRELQSLHSTVALKKTVNITPGSIGAATSAQGTKADNAVPEVTFTSSSLNVSAVKDSKSKKVALTAEMEWVEFE